MSDIYERLGKRVRLERERLGWTQEYLAEKAGMHPAYVGQIERNKKKVSLAAVERLCAALAISPGVLLASGRPSTKPPTWRSRVEGILRDRPPSEQALLYNTLKHLAKGIRKHAR